MIYPCCDCHGRDNSGLIDQNPKSGGDTFQCHVSSLGHDRTHNLFGQANFVHSIHDHSQVTICCCINILRRWGTQQGDIIPSGAVEEWVPVSRMPQINYPEQLRTGHSLSGRSHSRTSQRDHLADEERFPHSRFGEGLVARPLKRFVTIHTIPNFTAFQFDVYQTCDAILSLLTRAGHPEYFEGLTPLLGPIVQAAVYRKPILLHKDLADVYRTHLEHMETHGDDYGSFSAGLEHLLNRLAVLKANGSATEIKSH